MPATAPGEVWRGAARVAMVRWAGWSRRNRIASYIDVGMALSPTAGAHSSAA